MTRSLDWDGCANVRDLGGVPLAGGGHSQFGVFVRADNVRRLSEAGWAGLTEKGVRRIVDLRWPEELAQDPPRDSDVEAVHISLLGELDPDFVDEVDTYMEANDPGGYWAAFYVLALEQYRDNFGAAIAAIADAPDGVVLFHCAGGKDRTGLIAALLLRLAGATIHDVAVDYALSEENIPTGPGSWIESAPTEEERRRRRFKQQTPTAAMTITLEALDERYGDVCAYLRSAGVSDDQIARLRERLAAP